MINFSPSQERDKLGFIDAVRLAFEFLEEDYGFSLEKTESNTWVRYESETTFVQVYHGRGSYELGVEIGLLSSQIQESERPFTLQEIMQLHAEAGEPPPNYQASNKEAVKKFVRKLADLVKKYGQEALSGDPDTYKKLAEIRSRNHKNLTVEWTRSDAEKAWKENDYNEVVRLLESIQDELTPAEHKKLEYARKKVAEPTD